MYNGVQVSEIVCWSSKEFLLPMIPMIAPSV